MKFNPNKYEVNLNFKIIDVLKIFEKNRVNICAVTNKKNEFVGIITLSDVKKAFLKGASLEQKIINFINKNPLIIKGEVNENNISDILSSSKFNNIDPPLIPIINLQKKLVNILDKNELFKKRYFKIKTSFSIWWCWIYRLCVS